jgi:branched-chain amino acid transport system permease protein
MLLPRRGLQLALSLGIAAGRDLWPIVVGTIGVLLLSPYWMTIGIGVGVYCVAALGLAFMMRFGGLPSFMQGTFIGVAMYAVAKSPWSFGEASLAFAVLVGLVLALLIGVIALRLQHLPFLLGTLAVLFIVYEVVNGNVRYLGGPNGLPVPSSGPFGLKSKESFLLGITVLLSLSLVLFRVAASSRFARGARVAAVDNVLATSLGVRPSAAAFQSFVFGSTMATIAGALYAHFVVWVSPYYLGLLPSAELLLAATLGGGSPVGTVIGAVLIRVLPIIFGVDPSAQLVAFGASLAAVSLVFPHGIRWRGAIQKWIATRGQRTGAIVDLVAPHITAAVFRSNQAKEPESSRSSLPVLSAGPDNGSRGHETRRKGHLTVTDVHVRFGGVAAVRGVSLSVGGGQIVAVIGPNGAGKTTLINYITGFVPGEGNIMLDGLHLERLTAHQRARLGVVRTFQIARATPELTVWELVVGGGYRLGRSTLASGLLGADLRERQRLERIAMDICRSLNITHLLDRPLDALSGGELKMVELARALAAWPLVMLLDEPVAGVDMATRARLAEMVKVATAMGTAVLLVEHNMDFVRAVADECVVLDQGTVIAKGKVDEILQDQAVLRAYLGR